MLMIKIKLETVKSIVCILFLWNFFFFSYLLRYLSVPQIQVYFQDLIVSDRVVPLSFLLQSLLITRRKNRSLLAVLRKVVSRLEDNGEDIELYNLACNILAPGSHSQV